MLLPCFKYYGYFSYDLLPYALNDNLVLINIYVHTANIYLLDALHDITDN